MRRTRIKMMAAVMAATMLLGGCGDALYDLTDDEENVIVNYAAHIVTKYNTYQREGLTYVSPEEPEETQEDVTVPQTPETQDASETGTAASAEAAAPAVSVAAAGSASLDQLFGADGIQMTYAGAQLAPGYMEGDYYEMTPDAGKQYLVLSIDVTNTGADGVGLDVLSVSPKFTVVLNQSRALRRPHCWIRIFPPIRVRFLREGAPAWYLYSRCRMMWRRQTVWNCMCKWIK